MNKIINPQSCYFNQNCRIIKKLENQKLEVLLEEEEILIEVSCEDVDVKRELCKPRSRKELYCHIKDPMTTRNDMKATINYLIMQGGIITENIDALMSLVDDTSKDQDLIVEELRSMRDSGLIELTLPNAIYEKKPHFKQKNNRFNNRK